MQPEPEALALREVVLGVHGNDCPHAGEAVDHDANSSSWSKPSCWDWVGVQLAARSIGKPASTGPFPIRGLRDQAATHRVIMDVFKHGATELSPPPAGRPDSTPGTLPSSTVSCPTSLASSIVSTPGTESGSGKTMR